MVVRSGRHSRTWLGAIPSAILTYFSTATKPQQWNDAGGQQTNEQPKCQAEGCHAIFRSIVEQAKDTAARGQPTLQAKHPPPSPWARSARRFRPTRQPTVRPPSHGSRPYRPIRKAMAGPCPTIETTRPDYWPIPPGQTPSARRRPARPGGPGALSTTTAPARFAQAYSSWRSTSPAACRSAGRPLA